MLNKWDVDDEEQFWFPVVLQVMLYNPALQDVSVYVTNPVVEEFNNEPFLYNAIFMDCGAVQLKVTVVLYGTVHPGDAVNNNE